MKKASDEDLKILHESAADVYGQILAGGDPKTAVVKVAKEASYSRAWTSRLCEVTNRLLAVEHIESAGTKAASEHPLVDVDQVLIELFPTKVNTNQPKQASTATGGHRQYRYSDLGRQTVKQASATPPEESGLCGFPDEKSLLDRADAVRAHLKTARTMVQVRESDAECELAPVCKLAVSAIRESGENPAEIEERAVAWFGKDAHCVMDAIGAFATDFARFQGKPRVFTTNPWDKEPFSSVKSAVVAFRQHALELDTHRRVADIALRVENQITHGIQKAAGMKEGGTAAGFILGKIPTSINETSKPSTSTSSELATAGMTDEDVAFLNSIKARQALVGALLDPVISRSDIGDVIRAYNRTGDVAPRSFMNETALVSLLRKALEEPDLGGSDITQMQDVEKGLAQQQDVTNV